MSDEEVLETEQLMIQITSSVDAFHSCRSLSASPLKRVSDLIYADRERIDWDTYKDMSGEEWKFLLESATAALWSFNEKYVPEEQQSDFGALIDQFHEYNSNLLKGYQSPNEWRVQYELLQDGHHIEEIPEEDIVPSNEVQVRIPSTAANDKTAYLDELKAYFGHLAVLKGIDVSGGALMPSGQKKDAEDRQSVMSEAQEDSAYREELKAYFAQFSSSEDGRIAHLMNQLSSEDCELKKQIQSGGHSSYLTQDEGWERCVQQIQGYWEKLDQ